MKEDLSQLVAVLLEQAKTGEDLSSAIARVRTEIKKAIEGGDTIVARLHALEESFREVIPEEKLRYQASIKALSTTSSLSRQEIFAAVEKQVEELSLLEKLLGSVLPAITEIRTEITSIRQNFGEPRGEIAAEQPVSDAAVRPERAGDVQSTGETGINKDSIFPDLAPAAAVEQYGEQPEPRTTPGPVEGSEPGQRCPMCDQPMDCNAADRKWHCLSCGFECNKNEGRFKKEEDGGRSNALLAIPLTEPLFDSPSKKSPGYWDSPKKKTPSLKKAPALTKTCPACGKKMLPIGTGKGWQCRECGYEKRI